MFHNTRLVFVEAAVSSLVEDHLVDHLDVRNPVGIGGQWSVEWVAKWSAVQGYSTTNYFGDVLVPVVFRQVIGRHMPVSGHLRVAARIGVFAPHF